MTKLFDLASDVMTSLALLCAILAVLAVPNTAQADPIDDCKASCGPACLASGDCTDQNSPQCTACKNACLATCLADSGLGMACDVTCTASKPMCGIGVCAPPPADCVRYKCIYKPLINQCECAIPQ